MRIAIDWGKRLRELAVLAGVGTFFAIIQPYGSTSALPFWGGWLYWVGIIIYGAFVGEATTFALLKFFPNWPNWAVWLALTLVTALFISPAIILIQYFALTPVPLSYWPRLYGLVAIICAAMTTIGMVLNRLNDPESPFAPESDTDTDPHATFMERLPLAKRKTELYAVSSEDHYLRVHTSGGEELILMRLADAIRELGDAKGLQTHRSWWVHEDGIEEASSSAGKITLKLKSGSEAPVSRTYAKAVREKGWV